MRSPKAFRIHWMMKRAMMLMAEEVEEDAARSWQCSSCWPLQSGPWG